MSSFKFNKSVEGKNLNIQFMGLIDEHADLTDLTFEHYELITIDLSQLKGMNSVGIKNWFHLMESAPANSKIVLEKVPTKIIETLNSVFGFLPKNGQVESFYAPYFCPTCEKENQKLMIDGQDFQWGQGKQGVKADIEKCDRSDCEMGLDVILDRYFQFLGDN